MKKFLIMFFVALAQVCAGQQSITWTKIFNGPNTYNDGAYASCVSTNSTYFVGGISGKDMYILRINNYGDTLWSKSYDSGIVRAMVSSNDGGCVFSGGASPNSISFASKIDSNGNVVWNKYYQSDHVLIYDIIKTNDGGYFACGTINILQGYILKIKPNGDLEWDRVINGINTLALYATTPAKNNGYYIVGNEALIGNSAHAVLYRFTQMGDQIWKKRIQVLNQDADGRSLVNYKNNLLMCGTILDTTINKGRTYFSKLDTSGNVLFAKTLQSPRYEIFSTMKTTFTNKFIFGTVLYSQNQDTFYTRLYTTDTLGNILSERYLPSVRSYVHIYSIIPLNNGDMIFSGGIDDTYTNFEDILVLRTDENLNSPPLAINQVIYNIPPAFKLYQNYPNPFNPKTTINFDVSKKNYLEMIIYNIEGKEVQILTRKIYKEGNYKVDWNGDNFPSGIYFCKLRSVNTIETIKLVLIK